jgi:demethylmenaquinone methyltransferase / 2-methoxy-6-polyprenyl-1,4-benzoquinol methylase
MKPPAEKNIRHLMRRMFSIIAPRYDFITRALSCGMDGRWKREAVARASLPENAVILDLACGTGDFSRLVGTHSRNAKSVAVDLTQPMLELARARGQRDVVCADAARLPFADASFDCLFIGYGLRNFPHLESCVCEISRVTAPGGKIVSLDFFLPEHCVFRELYLGWLFLQGAVWGLLLHGRPRTYAYISHSLRSFVSLDGLSSVFRRCGYAHIQTRAYISEELPCTAPQRRSAASKSAPFFSVFFLLELRREKLRLHNLIADRVAHQLAHRVHLQLSHHVRAMGFHRFHAHVQGLAHVLAALALCN